MARPKRIKLGAHVIPVKYHKAYLTCDEAGDGVVEITEDGDIGMMTLANAWTIHVSEHSADHGITMLHECFHAIMRTTGTNRLLDSREAEECIVAGFSQAVVELLRRNPGLAEYLVKGE